MTRTIARVLLAVPGLFIATTGIVFLLSPASAADKLLLGANTAEALSNIRGMAGAPLFSVGSMLLLSSYTQKLEYARPAALFLLTLLGARVLSYGVDGAPGSIALFLTIPSVAFGMMLAGHKLLDHANETEGSPTVLNPASRA